MRASRGLKAQKCPSSDGTDTIGGRYRSRRLLLFFRSRRHLYDQPFRYQQARRLRPPNVGDDALDSDGVPDGLGFSVTTVTVVGGDNHDTDFGFFTPPASATGHRHAGILEEPPGGVAGQHDITVGGVTYTKAQAIAWLGKVGKDKTTTMFSSLVPAMLNVMIGNDGSCVSSTIVDANAWMAHVRTSGQQRGGVELRVDRRRTDAPARWTTTTTACSARRIATRIVPDGPPEGHRAFFVQPSV